MPRPTLDSAQRLATDTLIKPLRADKSSPLALQAYGEIRAILFRGRFQQGESLRMDELCQRLCASKQPIMDALKRLAHEGYLSIIPQVGCKVRIYSRNEVREYFRLYAAADGLLAELAAERATETQLQRLEALSACIGRLVTKPSPGAQEAAHYRKLNREFHQLIRATAGSWPVAEATEQMHDRSDFFTVTMRHAMRADRVQSAHSEHQRLIVALRGRDPQAAREAMEQHILAVGARLWQND